MDLFKDIAAHEHEQVVFCHEPACGYFGIIAIHDTTLGPALGGTRFWQYESTDAAITDALRLARGMTYKAAVAGLSLGGGKSVIIGDNKRTDREAVFRAHGRFVESLGGRYITAEDVGTSPADMEFVRYETNHVAGLTGLSGDPSPVTAHGVYVGIKATAKAQWGSDSLAGKTVLVQGCGHVGQYLCDLPEGRGGQAYRDRRGSGQGQEGGGRHRRHGGRRRQDLRPGGRRLRTLRARRRHQRRHPQAAQGRHRGGRRQQPAGRDSPRRRAGGQGQSCTRPTT